MIVAGDLDAAGRFVDDGLVYAAVAERQLVGTEAESPTEQLVAETDSKEGHALAQNALQQFDVPIARARVAWTVRVEGTDRFERHDLGERGGLRKHVHVEPALGKVVERRGLHPEIKNGEVAQCRANRVDNVRLGCRHLGAEIAASHFGTGLHSRKLGVIRELCVCTAEDAAAHGASVAQPAGHGARVDSADADDALRLEVVV